MNNTIVIAILAIVMSLVFLRIATMHINGKRHVPVHIALLISVIFPLLIIFALLITSIMIAIILIVLALIITIGFFIIMFGKLNVYTLNRRKKR